MEANVNAQTNQENLHPEDENETPVDVNVTADGENVANATIEATDSDSKAAPSNETANEPIVQVIKVNKTQLKENGDKTIDLTLDIGGKENKTETK